MGYGTVRISDSARGTLRDLARAEGTSMLALLDEAVESLRRQRFLEQVNAAFARLRDDPRAWADVEAERRAWDATLADGLVVGVPSHVPIDPPEGGVTRRTAILWEAVRPLSVERLVAPRGRVGPATMAAVEDRLRILMRL